MTADTIAVIKIRELLLVAVPSDPDDHTITALQEKVLGEMERYESTGLVLDISTVRIVDSFFSRVIAETAQMVTLMGGRTVIVGMSPNVAITTTQLGLSLGNALTALDMDRALELLGMETSGSDS